MESGGVTDATDVMMTGLNFGRDIGRSGESIGQMVTAILAEQRDGG